MQIVCCENFLRRRYVQLRRLPVNGRVMVQRLRHSRPLERRLTWTWFFAFDKGSKWSGVTLSMKVAAILCQEAKVELAELLAEAGTWLDGIQVVFRIKRSKGVIPSGKKRRNRTPSQLLRNIFTKEKTWKGFAADASDRSMKRVFIVAWSWKPCSRSGFCEWLRFQRGWTGLD